LYQSVLEITARLILLRMVLLQVKFVQYFCFRSLRLRSVHGRQRGERMLLFRGHV